MAVERKLKSLGFYDNVAHFENEVELVCQLESAAGKTYPASITKISL